MKDTGRAKSATASFAAIAAIIAIGASAASAQKSNDPSIPFAKFAESLGLQTEFSADMETQLIGIPVKTRILRSGDNSRTDSSIAFTNVKTSKIQTVKDGTVSGFTLYHATKKYVVLPSQPVPDTVRETVVTDLGTEIHNGEECAKKRITVINERSSLIEMLFSPSQQNMPVKMTVGLAQYKPDETEPTDSVTLMTATFNNYDFTKPDASAFTIPADFTQAANEKEALQYDAAMDELKANIAAIEAAKAELKAKKEEEAAKTSTQIPFPETPVNNK